VGSDTTPLAIAGWVLIVLVIGIVVALLPRVFGPRIDPQLRDPHRWPEDEHGD
jgi:hypothetical protein